MAEKASNLVRYYENPNGPTIGTVSRTIIEKDGLYFKDLDGSGEYKPYDDWRLPAAERAAEYVKTLTVEEKIGQLFFSDWRMGLFAHVKSPMMQGIEWDVVLDETGLLDESEIIGKNIFGEQKLPGTTTLLKDWWARHLILRSNPKPDELVDWMNQLHAVAEECEHLFPYR